MLKINEFIKTENYDLYFLLEIKEYFSAIETEEMEEEKLISFFLRTLNILKSVEDRNTVDVKKEEAALQLINKARLKNYLESKINTNIRNIINIIFTKTTSSLDEISKINEEKLDHIRNNKIDINNNNIANELFNKIGNGTTLELLESSLSLTSKGRDYMDNKNTVTSNVLKNNITFIENSLNNIIEALDLVLNIKNVITDNIGNKRDYSDLNFKFLNTNEVYKNKAHFETGSDLVDMFLSDLDTACNFRNNINKSLTNIYKIRKNIKVDEFKNVFKFVRDDNSLNMILFLHILYTKYFINDFLNLENISKLNNEHLNEMMETYTQVLYKLNINI